MVNLCVSLRQAHEVSGACLLLLYCDPWSCMVWVFLTQQDFSVLSFSSPHAHHGKWPDDGRNWSEWRWSRPQLPRWLEVTLERRSVDLNPRIFPNATPLWGGGGRKDLYWAPAGCPAPFLVFQIGQRTQHPESWVSKSFHPIVQSR